MNLIIDIGNTQVKIAVFDANNTLVAHHRNSVDSISNDIQQWLEKYDITHAIISKVGAKIPRLTTLLMSKNIALLQLNSELKLPFHLAYKTPNTIGADRLALAAGAILLKKNHNLLVIDAGTCVTYDFIDANNTYFGGAISPGLPLRYKSLNDYTENLPLLHANENPIALIGNSTESSIQSGVVLGLVAEIEGIIVKYKLKFKDLTVFLTGGEQKLLDSYIKNKIFVNSKFILLEGMNYILNLNK